MSTSKNRYFLLILLPFLAGCAGTRYLKDNQDILVSQTIQAPAEIDQEPLRNLYAQRPNRKILGIRLRRVHIGIPLYVEMYYLGLRRYDQNKFKRKKEQAEAKFDTLISRTTDVKRRNNLQFRKQKKIDKYNSRIENGNQFMQWGEPVAVFDTTMVQTTVSRFKSHLFAEGYFHNTITTKVSTFLRRVSVTYRIETGPPYMIDSLFFTVRDSTLLRILLENQAESHIKTGQRYREENLTKERERLDLMLKDKGYYDFSRQYIDFRVDSTLLGNHRLALNINISNPAKRGYHKQFVIDSVRFTTDAGVVKPGRQRQARTYRDIQYSYYDDLYSLKILTQRLFIFPGTFYNRSNTFNSQRQLANLDAFKFVNINYDTSGGRFIARIFTSPLDRYEWSNEVGLNITQGYPGPFYNINFKKRNIFRGLENFELNGRIGIEGVASYSDDLDVYRSIEAGTNASLIFPQFLWPLRDAKQIRFGKYNPKTRLSLGYSFTDRPEYKRISTTLSNTYTWQNKRSTQYSLALTNVSLINSVIQNDTFRYQLKRLDSLGNYNLVRSFNPSFVSSMIFGMTWNRDYGTTFDKNATFIRAQFETGGTSLNIISPSIISDRGLQYFKYLRFNFDVRRLNVLNKWSTLAYRVNSGLAYSYGKDRSLPYEKFYFAGGSNSVRAWRPRRLGLGSVPPALSGKPTKDGTFNYQFEKPGEILLEASIEVRRKLFGFIDGAVFVDAGNVWAVRQAKQEEEGNSQFKVDSFYKELGVGTGFGLRFDFTFLILRFDVGIKAYDPARDPGDRFVLDKMKFLGPFAREIGEDEFADIREPVIYNVGIGYPF
ncbi:MAG TPA: BamA/TamA family outer membrane protein [Chryseosolibacter sp.]|nr:BamA/TamA family outer membrane protein [Chryseosolibacter sp.]